MPKVIAHDIDADGWAEYDTLMEARRDARSTDGMVEVLREIDGRLYLLEVWTDGKRSRV